MFINTKEPDEDEIADIEFYTRKLYLIADKYCLSLPELFDYIEFEDQTLVK